MRHIIFRPTFCRRPGPLTNNAFCRLFNWMLQQRWWIMFASASLSPPFLGRWTVAGDDSSNKNRHIHCIILAPFWHPRLLLHHQIPLKWPVPRAALHLHTSPCRCCMKIDMCEFLWIIGASMWKLMRMRTSPRKTYFLVFLQFILLCFFLLQICVDDGQWPRYLMFQCFYWFCLQTTNSLFRPLCYFYHHLPARGSTRCWLHFLRLMLCCFE